MATTVQEYLDGLSEDRRRALQAVRAVILKNLPEGYEEGIQYRMIGYYVPHSVYAPGYYCDPTQPVPFVNLASQKHYMSFYLNFVLLNEDLKGWFEEAYAKSGKKLNMGKSCVRFKKADDLALDVIGEVIRRVPPDEYIARMELARARI